MKSPNPLNPDHMSPAERRTELCRLLALGIIRLHQREHEPDVPFNKARENCLNVTSDQYRHESATNRRTAA